MIPGIRIILGITGELRVEFVTCGGELAIYRKSRNFLDHKISRVKTLGTKFS